MVECKNGDWISPTGGGGGGTSLPPGTTIEVEAAGDLTTALASNTGVYVSGDISISTTISITGNKRITIAPGVTITAAAGLTTTSAFDITTTSGVLNIQCDGTWDFVAAHTGYLIESSDNDGDLNMIGKMSTTTASSGKLFSGHSGFAEHVNCIAMKDAAYSHGWQGNIGLFRVGELILTGAGTTNSHDFNGCHIEFLKLSGTFRAYTSAILTQFAVKARGETTIGLVAFDGTQDIGILSSGGTITKAVSEVTGDLNLAVEGAHGSTPICFDGNASLVLSGSTAYNKVVMPGNFQTDVKGESGAAFHTLISPAFGSTTMENFAKGRILGGVSSTVNISSTVDDCEWIGHHFTGIPTLSGQNNRFTNCYFASSFTVPSGADSVFENCVFVGTLTISSGAQSIFIGCHIRGTFTNNDGFKSSLIGCHDGTGGGWWGNNDGRIEYLATSTTDATQTELTFDGTNRFTLASDQTAMVNIRVLAQRDNQDWASFYWINCVIANDGGVYAISNGTASTGPDWKKGSGSTLTLALDASSGLRIRGTGNAAENWDWKTVIDIIHVTN
jgi:hypothetical protein